MGLDFLHKQVGEGLGYVPGVCWNFLGLELSWVLRFHSKNSSHKKMQPFIYRAPFFSWSTVDIALISHLLIKRNLSSPLSRQSSKKTKSSLQIFRIFGSCNALIYIYIYVHLFFTQPHPTEPLFPLKKHATSSLNLHSWWSKACEFLEVGVPDQAVLKIWKVWAGFLMDANKRCLREKHLVWFFGWKNPYKVPRMVLCRFEDFFLDIILLYLVEIRRKKTRDGAKTRRK